MLSPHHSQGQGHLYLGKVCPALREGRSPLTCLSPCQRWPSPRCGDSLSRSWQVPWHSLQAGHPLHPPQPHPSPTGTSPAPQTGREWSSRSRGRHHPTSSFAGSSGGGQHQAGLCQPGSRGPAPVRQHRARTWLCNRLDPRRGAGDGGTMLGSSLALTAASLPALSKCSNGLL